MSDTPNSSNGSPAATEPRAARELVVRRYEPTDAARWDEFVGRSKNGVFLFFRRYMDYHADRFTDHSLLFCEDEKVVAVLPANVRDDALFSHGGLTFGGVLSDNRMRTATMLRVFEQLKGHLRREGLSRLVYKAIPHIYHRAPAEEDLYALHRFGARLIRRDVSCTLRMAERLPLAKGRKWTANKTKTQGLEVGESRDFAGFMAVEEEHLRAKYGTRPTHTAAELELLAGRFPENIRLFTASRAGAMLAGVVVYQSVRVAHTQYIAATTDGFTAGATDAIFHHLFEEVYRDIAYFDFGISTEDEGRYLNVGLIENKESYGGRAVCHDFYELDAA